MALDLVVTVRGKVQGGESARLSLEDNGYYWFLHPFFERMRAQSGKSARRVRESA
ncbi:MAG TPA: hypothetical protein VFQ35_06470 [Polyangiaceae bacterium]|nr:hypothetical protein [Polyangiaceae bacterium]